MQVFPRQYSRHRRRTNGTVFTTAEDCVYKTRHKRRVETILERATDSIKYHRRRESRSPERIYLRRQTGDAGVSNGLRNDGQAYGESRNQVSDGRAGFVLWQPRQNRYPFVQQFPRANFPRSLVYPSSRTVVTLVRLNFVAVPAADQSSLLPLLACQWWLSCKVKRCR